MDVNYSEPITVHMLKTCPAADKNVKVMMSKNSN